MPLCRVWNIKLRGVTAGIKHQLQVHKINILAQTIHMCMLGPGKLQVTIVRILPNKRSQLSRYCLVWGIRSVYGLTTVGQVTIKLF